MRPAVYILFFLPAWVFSQSDGLVIDQQTRLTIRGMGSRDPYGSNRVKDYLNDIPITGEME